MSKVAYGILCHQSAHFVREQFELLSSPDAWFFYHVDLKAPQEIRDYVSRLALTYPNVSVLPSTLCAWGGFSLTTVMVNLIRAALSRSPWDHLIFLSEQHLPLQSHSVITSALKCNHNYLELSKFESLPPVGQSDIRSRFAQTYVELPGVGGFGTARRVSPDTSFFRALYHGSQWMTLSHWACELISTRDVEYFEPFCHSVLSDEHALQTWVGQATDNPLVNECRSLTFIANPSMGGSRDMIFDDRLFLAARDAGYLFIRKRPAILSDSVYGWYAHIIPVSGRQSAGAVGASGDAMNLAPELIMDRLNRIAGKGIQLVQMGASVLGPSFFCEIRHTGLLHPFAVYVLSQDLHAFKVIAVYHGEFLTFDESTISAYRASVIRARAHDLSFHREIHLGSDYNDGFYNVSGAAALGGLMNIIEIFVARTMTLATGSCSSR